MKFLTKLDEMLKNFANAVAHSKIVRGGAAFAMALSIAAATGACTTTPNPDSDLNHTPTPNGPSVVAPDNDDDDSTLSQYSQILQNVLTSSYYNGIFDQYIANKGIYSNKHAPLPFKFLQSQGHDVDAYKNDKLGCLGTAYINENDKSKLYLSVKAENENADRNYYTNYLLSYPLTAQEYEDLYMLHKEEYRQASYFIQELDNQQTAKIESKANVNVETYDKFLKAVNSWKIIKDLFSDSVIIDIVGVDAANLSTSINVRSIRTNPISDMINKSELRKLDVSFTLASHFSYNNYLFMDDPGYTKAYINLTEFQENYTPIICFDSQIKTPNYKDLNDEIK